MKKIISALLSIAIAVFAFSGCGNGDGSKGSSSASEAVLNESIDEKSSTAVVDEPDFMGFLVGEGDTDFIGMSFDEFNETAGGKFTEENAIKYESYDPGELYAEFSLGKKDTMLGGRVKLDKEHEITCVIECKDNKVKCAKERIDGLTKDEAKKICEDYISAFDGKLPEGFVQFPPSERGKTYEVGFSRTIDDHVFSMTYDEDLSGDHYVYFSIQIYAERYGMK